MYIPPVRENDPDTDSVTIAVAEPELDHGIVQRVIA
jgi:hypothetical protein